MAGTTRQGQAADPRCRQFQGWIGQDHNVAYLSQYLALQGFRVLAIDLDPQASLSALYGYQPEFDIGPNETLYGAIRYDADRRPCGRSSAPLL